MDESLRQLTWARGGPGVKWVTMTDRLTGLSAAGRDWASWEEALHKAEVRLEGSVRSALMQWAGALR